MNPDIVDTHAHLDDVQFQNDLQAVLERAAAARVIRILSVAVSAASSAASIELARRHPQLVASVGIHPNAIAEAAPDDWTRIEEVAQNEGVVAIGETGLDRHWNQTPFPLQEDFFARHLALSRKLRLPIVIHCREAESDILRMIRADYERNGPLKGIMHSFTADSETANACQEMGLHISFAGMVTFKNAAALRDVAAAIAFDRILVETDSPYLSPVPVRGKRNEPANVQYTLAVLAACRNVPVESLAARITQNAASLFGESWQHAR